MTEKVIRIRIPRGAPVKAKARVGEWRMDWLTERLRIMSTLSLCNGALQALIDCGLNHKITGSQMDAMRSIRAQVVEMLNQLQEMPTQKRPTRARGGRA